MPNFTRKLSFLLPLLLTATLGLAQTVYQTVGLVGAATAGGQPIGWNTSIPMQLVSPTNLHQWTLTLPLTQGELKFRANDTWDVNWGGSTFPTGTGVRNDQNIVIPQTSRFTVLFDDVTGAYQFSLVTAAKAARPAAGPLSLALVPNPAHGGASLRYELPAAATATVVVYNLIGQPVRQLAPQRQGAGPQSQALPLQGLAPGIYLVQLRAGTHLQTARLVVE